MDDDDERPDQLPRVVVAEFEQLLQVEQGVFGNAQRGFLQIALVFRHVEKLFPHFRQSVFTVDEPHGIKPTGLLPGRLVFDFVVAFGEPFRHKPVVITVLDVVDVGLSLCGNLPTQPLVFGHGPEIVQQSQLQLCHLVECPCSERGVAQFPKE